MREENSNACCIPIPNAARHPDGAQARLNSSSAGFQRREAPTVPTREPSWHESATNHLRTMGPLLRKGGTWPTNGMRLPPLPDQLADLLPTACGAAMPPLVDLMRHAPRGASGLSRWHADPGRSRSGSRLLRFHRSFLLTLRSKLWRMQASLSTLGSPRTIVKEFALISCPPGNTRQSCTCKDSARLLETDRGRQFSLMLTEA